MILKIIIVLIITATSSHASGLSVDLLEDRVNDLLELSLLLLVVLSVGVLVVSEPRDDILNGLLNGLLVRLIELSGELVLIFELVLEVECHRLEGVLSLNLLLHGLILIFKLLGGA